jgi:16S rRNA (guanine527-N7)-methyltransferase
MEIILKYFPELSVQQKKQFLVLGHVYSDWNEKINVISRKDISELYERHVLHSLTIAKIIKFSKGTNILDVGTGGGFPGIPLAILFPDVNFHLIDSIGKKIKVVNAVASDLGLSNVKAEQIRVEEIKNTYDFVVSRAVTAFPKFISWVKERIASEQKNRLQNGILYLKGGDFQAEINPYKKEITVYELNQFFNEEYFETKKLIYLPLERKKM